MKKRIFAIILAMCLLFTGTNVFYAEENDESVTEIENAQLRETLMDKAVQAFPEYESEIRGENISEITYAKMRSGGLGEVVISETRTLSETEIVSYTEFDSGVAFTAIGLMEGKNITEELDYGTNTSVKMNVWLQCGNSESVLFVKNIKYSIYENEYDVITEKGSLDWVLCTAFASRKAQNLFETSSSNAYLEYEGEFEFEINYGANKDFEYIVEATLRVEVGDNTCIISSY